jgi:hypothetical protein
VGGIQAPQAGRLRLPPILRFVSRFEFVQSEWMNDRAFFGGSPGRDPISGAADGTGTFDIPQTADSSAAAESAPIRGHARRRILLHARVAGAVVARELNDVSSQVDAL